MLTLEKFRFTLGLLALVAAVAAQACQVEKHSTIHPARITQEIDDTCETSLDSGVDVEGTLILVANTFWDTSKLGTYGAQVGGLIASMPGTLKHASLSAATDRARQLQWAVYVANHLISPPPMRIVVPSCDYDFSGRAHDPLLSPPSDTSGAHAAFLPRLFLVGGTQGAAVSLEGDPVYPAPTLFYSGPGYDGAGTPTTRHGRVLVMVPSQDPNPITIKRLHLHGDHSWAHWREAEYYLHENTDELNAEQDRRYWHGMLMIGLAGGANDVTLEGVSIDGVSRAGIAIVGNATVEDSTITGIVPLAYSGMRSDLVTIEGILTGVFQVSPGFSYQTGIEQRAYQYGPTVIRNNTLLHVVEGLNGGGGPWTIDRNNFTAIGDHGVYLLGLVEQSSTIHQNTFFENSGQAIKIGGQNCGNPCVPTDPIDPLYRTGGFATLISDNIFHLVPLGAIVMSGTFNTIEDNTIFPYNVNDDPTGGQYAPGPVASTDVYPDLWFGTGGGQAGYANHFAFNKVTNNTKGGQPLTVFVQQGPAERDESISFNTVSGADQVVYFWSKKASQFAPTVSLGNGSTLVIGAPSNCADCYPNSTEYRTNIDATWMLPVSYKDSAGTNVPQLLVRYGSAPDTFLIGDNGVHARLAPDSTAITVLASTDLNGDGLDEIYYRVGTSSDVKGSQVYANFDTRVTSDLTASTAWTYASSSTAPVAAAPLKKREGSPRELVLAYPNDDNLYGTTNSGGLPVRGSPVYTGSSSTPLFPPGSALTTMISADAATVGETGGAPGEELYAAFNNYSIVGIYWDASSSTWQLSNVYAGTQLLSLMAPGRLRSGENKQRIYQRFAGSYIYETVPPSGTSLPGFGTGSVFYSGTAYCDMLVAGDFDSDGLDEMANHYVDIPTKIYWGEQVTGGSINPNAGLMYDGFATSTLLRRIVDSTNHDRLMTIFYGIRTMYLSEGLADNGYDYADWIRQAVWTSLGLS